MTGLLLTLRPQGNVTANHHLSGGGYSAVDEDPANDSDYVYPASDEKSDAYEMTDPPSFLVEGAPTINSVKVYSRIRRNDGINAGGYGFGVRTHSTYYWSAGGRAPISWTNYSYTYSANPYSGSAWTWSEITALQTCVKLNAVIVEEMGTVVHQCSQVYCVVDWQPPEARRFCGIRRI